MMGCRAVVSNRSAVVYLGLGCRFWEMRMNSVDSVRLESGVE